MTYHPRHVWRCEFNDDASSCLELATSNIHCSEIIEEFARYMLGAGFLHYNIVEAFEDYVDEYRPIVSGSNLFKTNPSGENE